MTFDSILALLLSVVIPMILAAGGGVLAATTLPGDKTKSRWLWISFFLVFAIVAIGFAFVQQIRITTQQRAAETVSREHEEHLEGNQRYTEGQLDSINKVLVSLINSGGESRQDQSVLKGLVSSIAAIPRPTPPQSQSRPTSSAPASTPFQVTAPSPAMLLPSASYSGASSPYAKVESRRQQVENLNTQFNATVEQVMQSYARPYKSGMKLGPLPRELPDELADKLQMDDMNSVITYRNLQPLLYRAHDEAISCMQLVPNKVAEDASKFREADAKASAVTPSSRYRSLTQNNRFQDILFYLESLKHELGNYHCGS